MNFNERVIGILVLFGFLLNVANLLSYCLQRVLIVLICGL
jgi:hypothetical protein